jgi:hypothetical protein
MSPVKTVKLPDDAHRQAKTAASNSGTTLTAWLVYAINKTAPEAVKMVLWTWEYRMGDAWVKAWELLPEGTAKTFGGATEIRNVKPGHANAEGN